MCILHKSITDAGLRFRDVYHNSLLERFMFNQLILNKTNGGCWPYEVITRHNVDLKAIFFATSNVAYNRS